MTELDDALVPVALELLTDLGASATFTVDGGTYNRTTGDFTSSPTDYTANISPPFPAQEKYVNGDTVRESDLMCVVAASGLQFTPDVGLVVTFKSQKYRITRVNTIRSGEQVAIYQLFLRS